MGTTEQGRSSAPGAPVGAEQRKASGEMLARGLGWFSLGLGVAQAVAPRQVCRLVGVDEEPPAAALMRVVGARELVGGAGILAKPRPGGFLFARVIGDVMDMALLVAAIRSGRTTGARAVGAAGAVGAVTGLDVWAASLVSRASDPSTHRRAIRARSAITVNRPPEEVYAFWRDIENLPRFMAHLESVRDDGRGRSRWVAAAPAGATVEWEAELVDDVPEHLVAWRSLEGADVPNEGSVRFELAPGGKGTEVTVDLVFEPPAGAVGAAVARLFGEEPVQQVKDDLRRFKQVLETGEVVRSDGSPDGTRTQRQFHQEPAQPAGAGPERSGVQEPEVHQEPEMETVS
jgi:uncharacterized membrane protein